MYRIVPLGFFVGMFLMAALMSLAQLFFAAEYNLDLWSVVLYLLRAGPALADAVAWFTFWKSNWGTRPTPADVGPQKGGKMKP